MVPSNERNTHRSHDDHSSRTGGSDLSNDNDSSEKNFRQLSIA